MACEGMVAETVSKFPSLTADEFKTACAALVTLCTRCGESGEDAAWESMAECHGSQDNEYGLRLRKHLRLPTTTALVTGSDPVDKHEGQEDDSELFERPPVNDTIVVDFWVTLSPSYQCPVLWFNAVAPSPSDLKGFDFIYQYIVPPAYRTPLKDVGNIGGISMAINPLTDMPAFFIHPCNTPSALADFNGTDSLSPLHYLLLWLGVVGPSVNLYIPSSMATELS